MDSGFVLQAFIALQYPVSKLGKAFLSRAVVLDYVILSSVMILSDVMRYVDNCSEPQNLTLAEVHH